MEGAIVNCIFDGGLVCGTVYGEYRRLAGFVRPIGCRPPSIDEQRELGCWSIRSSPRA